jgi:hypothetical protein
MTNNKMALIGFIFSLIITHNLYITETHLRLFFQIQVDKRNSSALVLFYECKKDS